MKIFIDGEMLEGSPAELFGQLRDASFAKDAFATLADYLDYTAHRIEQLTDVPVPLTHCRTDEEKARELLDALESIGAVEIEDKGDE